MRKHNNFSFYVFFLQSIVQFQFNEKVQLGKRAMPPNPTPEPSLEDKRIIVKSMNEITQIHTNYTK